MTILIFLIVLAILVFVHELGHFIAAKTSRIGVKEFSIGFPPRIFSWKPKKSETKYSVGSIPFGGFVKIVGEDTEEDDAKEREDSLIKKPKHIQIWVLAAGIIFNLILAWVLLSVGFMSGIPTSAQIGDRGLIDGPRLTITHVLPDSPAHVAGIMPGDEVLFIDNGTQALQGADVTVSNTQQLIAASGDTAMLLLIKRAGENETLWVTPKEGVIDDTVALGVGLDTIGTIKLPVHRALWEGARATVFTTGNVAVGLVAFIGGLFQGSSSLAMVVGPVGLAGLVGEATQTGLIHLLSFTAFISINLALLNLIPFPALDGGRILFVIIEAIKGSPIKPAVSTMLNNVGFALLILLMLIVTYKDIARLVTG